jgi:hypothetical protein
LIPLSLGEVAQEAISAARAAVAPQYRIRGINGYYTSARREFDCAVVQEETWTG